MSAEDTVNQIISAARTVATQSATKADAFAQQGIAAADNFFSPAGVPNPTEPNISIPPFTNPDQDLGNEFRTEIANAFADLDPKLTHDINDFLDDWFPDFAGCLQSSTDDWVCNTIQSGATGIPVAVENAIWQRSRERELRDGRRRESAAVNEFAGRGFMLPAGALAVQIDEIRQDVADKVAGHSRDVAIKQVEVQIETIKFAVEQGIKLRLGVVTALVDFFRAKLGMYSLAKERATAYVDAKRSLWQAAAAYYQALVAAGKLHLDYDQIRIEAATRGNENLARFYASTTESRVRAAVAAAEAMGKIAEAAYGSQNTLANIESTTITSS